MSSSSAIETSVNGLGYELVDIERAPGGLLRVTIDHPPAEDGQERFINVDDCERVTRQLQHVLEVDGLPYERLEVSSPGLDRPLKTAADFARFSGEQVEVTLKVPFKGRKRFRGELMAQGAPGSGWRLLLAPTAAAAAAKRHAASKSGKKAAAMVPAPASEPEASAEEVRVLDFLLDEVRETRLVPVIDFKGRGSASQSAPAQSMRAHEEADGGLRQ